MQNSPFLPWLWPLLSPVIILFFFYPRVWMARLSWLSGFAKYKDGINDGWQHGRIWPSQNRSPALTDCQNHQNMTLNAPSLLRNYLASYSDFSKSDILSLGLGLLVLPVWNLGFVAYGLCTCRTCWPARLYCRVGGRCILCCSLLCNSQ